MKRIAKIPIKLAATGAMLVYVGIVYLMPFTCPILALTGIPCPGCGLTRAWLAALQGAVERAFVYHPMFWSVPILLLAFWLDGQFLPRQWAHRALLIGIAVGFLLVWVRRLWGGVAFC